MLRGDLRFELAAWDEAAADYRELARRFPKSYLAPVARFNGDLPRGEERRGGREGGLHRHRDPLEGDRGGARALFALGRIAEGAEAWDDAKTRYEQLDAEWPTSGWTQLAKNGWLR